MSPSFNSGPSSKPTNSQTAHLNEKSPVHGPVHSPVHSPQSRFCSVPGGGGGGGGTSRTLFRDNSRTKYEGVFKPQVRILW